MNSPQYVVHTKNLQQYEPGTVDLWSSKLEASPDRLVLGRETLLNTKIIIACEAIRMTKQQDINNKSNIENSIDIDHEYQVGDKGLITDKDIHGNVSCHIQGPYTIMQI